MGSFSVNGPQNQRAMHASDIQKERKIRTDNKVDASLKSTEFVKDLEGAVHSRESHVEFGTYKDEKFEYIKVSREEAKNLLQQYKEQVKQGFALADVDFNFSAQSLTLKTKTGAYQNGNIQNRSIQVNDESVDFYKKPTLKHGDPNATTVNEAIDDFKQTIGQMERPEDLRRMRHYAAVDLYLERNADQYSSNGEFGGEAYATGDMRDELLKQAKQGGVRIQDTDKPKFSEFSSPQLNKAFSNVYYKHIREDQQALSEAVSQEAPDVKVEVSPQLRFDNKVFGPKTQLTMLESGATGPAKGVNRFVGAISEGFDQLSGTDTPIEYGEVTSEGQFIEHCQKAWKNCPPDQHACVMISGHSGTPKSGNIDEGAFKGIHLNNTDNHSRSVLGPGSEDYGEWKKITAGAKPGDMIVINSCDGATTLEQQQAYAKLVQETFPEGVHLIISNGKAQADATCVNGYVVLTKK